MNLKSESNEKKLARVWLLIGPSGLIRLAGWAHEGSEKRIKEVGGEMYVRATNIQELVRSWRDVMLKPEGVKQILAELEELIGTEKP